MSGRDVERDLLEFFERAQTPEPSARLRGATAMARLQAGPVRRGGPRDARLGLSLVGLAASIVLTAGVLIVLANHANSTVLGPGHSASPSAQASMHTFGLIPSPSPSPSPSPTDTPAPIVSMGPPHTFTAAGPMDAPYTLSALLPDGSVLVTGDSSGQRPLGAELFDPATGRFSPTGSPSATHDYGTATTLADGRVLVAGGTDPLSQTPTNVAEIYDPKTGTFTGTGSMADSQWGQGAILLRDRRVLIVGGDRDGSPTSAELYDPSSGLFTPIAGPSTARYGCMATRLSDGRVLVVGGWVAGPANSGTAATLTSAEVFDPATDRFKPVGSTAHQHYSGTLTLLQDGRVLTIGGGTAVELFDPTSGKFGPTASMDLARLGATATLLRDGRVLIAGGSVELASTNLVDLASAEIYDPRTGKFSKTGSMSEPLPGATATLLQDGRVLIASGGSAELYQP